MSARGIMSSTAAALAMMVSVSCPPGVEAQEQSSAMAGMTYESLKALPDFSGWWSVEFKPGARANFNPLQVPLRPEIAAAVKEVMQKLAAGADPVDLGIRSPYCWQCFAGSNGGVEDYVEFLFTPGRVTITNESGLIRRLSLSDRPLAADLDESNGGTSVAHWEGGTLVVETGGLNPNAPYLPGPLGTKIGRNVRIVERMSLKDADTLEIALRMTAPELFTAPYETTTRYRRDRTHVFRELRWYGAEDRSIDPVTGRVRFDMTPPRDLPAPPTR